MFQMYCQIMMDVAVGYFNVNLPCGDFVFQTIQCVNLPIKADSFKPSENYKLFDKTASVWVYLSNGVYLFIFYVLLYKYKKDDVYDNGKYFPNPWNQ